MRGRTDGSLFTLAFVVRFEKSSQSFREKIKYSIRKDFPSFPFFSLLSVSFVKETVSIFASYFKEKTFLCKLSTESLCADNESAFV